MFLSHFTHRPTCAFYCSVFLFSYPHTTQGTLPRDSFWAGHWELPCAGGDGRNAFLLGTRVLSCSPPPRKILSISVSIPDLSLPNQIATCHPSVTYSFGLIVATSLFSLEMLHKLSFHVVIVSACSSGSLKITLWYFLPRSSRSVFWLLPPRS